MIMWHKLNIINELNYNCNQGFYLNYKKNSISNIDNNLNIKIPINIKCNNYYICELFFNKKNVGINIILNTKNITYAVNQDIIYDYKNDIFKIISIYLKNQHNYELFSNINVISPSSIDNTFEILNNSIKYLDIIKINDNLYDYIKEIIYYNYNVIVNKYNCNIRFIYNSKYNFISNNKICIIDKKKYFKNLNYIDSTNYKENNIKSLFNTEIVYIDIDFFTSNLYLKPYYKFHNDIKSENIFINYKNFVKNNNSLIYFFNVELLDDFIIIIKDVNKQKILNHPVIYSNSKIIIDNKFFFKNDIDTMKKIIINSNKISKSLINTSVYNHIFVNSDVKYLINEFNDNHKINVIPYIFKNIETDIKIFNNLNSNVCTINKIVIQYNSYCELNCGHSFIYHNFWNFINDKSICPYCSNKIKKITIYIHNQNLEYNLLGNEFKNFI